MLTYPSDSLPQIVCPMDEHAIPPNSFCSAPPHSEPPPPLLPFSSVTPSCAKNGISGHRRSGRIQEIRAQTPKKQSNPDGAAAQRASRQNLSPTKTQRESESMVQVSQSKQPKVDCSQETQNKDGVDISFAAEHQHKQKDQKSPQEKPENVVEQFAVDTTQSLDTTKAGMDTCGALAVGHSSPTGWVIGPLFQSFKSKMASFTEIVMSPVKLFRASSPPPCTDHPDKLDEFELQADGRSDAEHSEPNDIFHPEAQSENRNQQRLSQGDGAQYENTVALKYSKKLSFDVESATRSSGQEDECAISQKEHNSPDSVPLQHRPLACIVSEQVSDSSVLLQPSATVSASHKSKVKMSGEMEDQHDNVTVRLKLLPRKCTVNRSGVKRVASKTSTATVKQQESEDGDELVSHTNSVQSVCYAQPDAGCFQPDGGDDGRKTESQNSLTGDTQQLNPDTDSAAGLGGAKRGVELDCQSQEIVKRKRLTADAGSKDAKKQELINVASDRSLLRPQRREVVSLNPTVNKEETLKPAGKRQAVSTRSNKKAKAGRETQLNTQLDSSSGVMLVCSLDKSSGVSENNHQGSSSKVKPSGSCKRLKTRAGVGHPAVNTDNSMDLETTSNKQAEPEPSSEALTCPAIKPLQSTSKRRNITKKPLKRKSLGQSTTESDSASFSTSVEPSDLTPTDFNTSRQVQKEESSKTGPNQPSKRPKKTFKVAVKSGASVGSQEMKQCVENLPVIAKENQPKEGKGKIPMDPVYFEMTPFEGDHPVPSPSQPDPDTVRLESKAKHILDGKGRSTAPVSEEISLSDGSNSSSISGSGLRSGARRATVKARRAESQRRTCRVLHSRTRKGEEVTKSITMEDADLATASPRSAGNGLSRRLLRSYSCPEIPSLRPHDAPWTSSLYAPHHSRIHMPQQHLPPHTPVHHTLRSLRRARRHTVCSLEVEREIAPLCLRKEVYPTRRSLPYDRASQHLSPGHALSPSTSLSALASCFLSSPLAFLSKRADSRAAAAGTSTSSHASSPSSSSSPPYPLIFLQRIDSSSGTALDYSSSENQLECELERRRQSEEEDDGEDTSSSSQEFEDVGLREEKALSDSEIKVVQKHEERGKVSSIRIRKTLPKPQNNLTPMGLPKPIRLKKKEFSLEEIYTNKNFSKPPESRLETIFEVPLNRRNGSESWFGQRRLKRFLEFLDAGEARKPKKPLVGVGKAGVTSSRTRRGVSPKDEPSLSVQDVDSLLCAKLDQLNLWLVLDQKDS